MSKARYRLETIATKMRYIEEIVAEYGTITEALADEKKGAAAVLMHLTAIAEQFDKLSKEGEFALLAHFDKQDIKGLHAVRNFIVHDYEGVNLVVMERILREKLPPMHRTVDALLAKENNDDTDA